MTLTDYALDPSLPPITREEYVSRVHRAQDEMEKRQIDALFITSEDNFHYFTGFRSPVWVNLTRPRYCIVPSAGDPIIISASSNVIIVERTSWVRDVRTWAAPNPEDDGITLVIDALRQFACRWGRVAAELGTESRLTMPVGDFLRIQRGIAPIEIVDGMGVMMSLRFLKSVGEIARIRKVAQIASSAFEALPLAIEKGDTVFSACQKLKMDLLRRGADGTPYVIGVAGRDGYRCINLGPDGQALEEGDVLVIDTGSTFENYYCDFDREFAMGSVAPATREAYRRVWNSTEAGLAAVRPGNRACDVWRAMAEELGISDVQATGVGRMGHGLGLRMCEPPSVGLKDETVLVPGMVITLEPGISYKIESPNGPERRVEIHEENVLVTETGAELLTRRAPREIPIVAW